ncbi:glycoside hydrolase family 172 protein [Aporhodopirellula aestuarii]|uniref:DUF2961 domain-containing protein n=1 Tax=Aporhodopirellula aestuarii TaxID=2950107 RepID=A0ABT0U0K7_9BACT|nr:glycoside hydrolase family 172 protein [Aporhodopirellula aestuarii]MCM2370402.1 DUF2961 domain-containing protein [Aporhodopirellula aestuarii]
MKNYLLSLFAILLAISANVQAAEPVSIRSLLNEMIDRESVARFPAYEFRLKQHSSYNRASKTPEDPEGWFNNHDFNSNDKDKNFIRTEENNGEQEWVLMDHEGPGALVRTWMPFRNANRPSTDTRIRVYLDGATEPTLEGNMLGLFDGSGLIPYPFAHQSLRSAVSFFPIPYAKSCKVTVTDRPFFFQFTFREYAAETPVETFTMSGFNDAASQIDEVGNLLRHPAVSVKTEPQTLSATLEPKAERSIELPSGNAAVRSLSIKLGSYDDPSVTRSVILKMEFDGQETVWCPVGDFFGTGIGLHPFQGWYRTVSEGGTMSCRWVMPYQTSGKISLVNLNDEPVAVIMKVQTGDWTWDDRSLYFNAAWRGQYPVPTRPFSDWNYVTLQGRGVYVGDTLTIMNPVEKWWGEGDEKIFVDGEDFPSIFGTGTEDYYAYSWGGISTDFYEHPFHAQTRSHLYDKLNRKTSGEKNTQGYSTETRTRALDTMPFGSSLQLDMEVWSWTDCEMGYGVGTYWYADAATRSNRSPAPQEALNVPPLPNMDAASGGPKSFENSFEFEDLAVVSKPKGVELNSQSLTNYRGRWSKNGHVLVKGTQLGDVIEWAIPAQSPGAEKLVLHATKSYDFATLRFTVNGIAIEPAIDLFSEKPTPTGAIELGEFSSIDGAYTLQVEVVGKNRESSGFRFGIDCVSVTPGS